MKARIGAVSILLVTLILVITAVESWSAAPSGTATLPSPTPTATPDFPLGSVTLGPVDSVFLPMIMKVSGSTPTPTPTPLRVVSLDPPEGSVDTLVRVSISGQWTPGVLVFVTLLPRGVPIPPPDGQAVFTGASATTSNDGSPVVTQFRVPNDPRLWGPQPIQVIVHTGNWSEWVMEPFAIVDPRIAQLVAPW